MPKKKYNREGKIPNNLNEMVNIGMVEPITTQPVIMDEVLTNMHRSVWFPNSETWYHWLDDKLNDYIYNNFRFRQFQPKITDEYETPFDNFITWNITPSSAQPVFTHYANDYKSMSDEISRICENVFICNQEKYKKLFDAMTLEFNPLWNVDGTETTTRTLTRTGTETTAKTGTETDKKTGTETNAKTGTEFVEHDTTDTFTHDISDINQQTGTETNAQTGTITHAKTGHDDVDMTGTTTTDDQESKTSFNSSTAQATVNNHKIETPNTTESTTYNSTETETRNATDTITHNTTDTRTIDTDDERIITETNKTTHNTQDELTHNTTDTLTHNTQDELTLDTTESETITHERGGNIGVTMSTQLLESLWNLGILTNYIDVVAHDLMNAITIGVY